MRDLKIGDQIAVGAGGVYEPVYSFGHYEPNGLPKHFLELFTNRTTSLQISPDHLVFVYNPNKKTWRGGGEVSAVPAASVRVGDLLVFDDNNQAALVEAVKPLSARKQDMGLYSPFTPSGKFLANEGLLVSSFVGFDPSYNTNKKSTEAETMLDFLSSHHYHWLAHMFEFPHRVACYYLSSCPKETYTTNGLSTWVAWPLKMALGWMNCKSILLKATLLAAFVCVCTIFTVLEHVLFQQGTTRSAVLLLLILMITLWWLLLLPKKLIIATTIGKQATVRFRETTHT